MTLDSFKSLKNGCLKLVFETQDVKSDDGTIPAILAYIDKSVQVFIITSTEKIKEEDIPILDAPVKKDVKSKSKLLRDRLYVFWTKSGEPNFEIFYDKNMDKIIGWTQDKINKYE